VRLYVSVNRTTFIKELKATEGGRFLADKICKTYNDMVSPTQLSSFLMVFVFFKVCGATFLTTYAKFISRKAVASSFRSIEHESQIKCVWECMEEGRKGVCTVAGYNATSHMCQLSVDSPQDVVDVEDEMAGVFVIGLYNYAINMRTHFRAASIWLK